MLQFNKLEENEQFSMYKMNKVCNKMNHNYTLTVEIGL